MPPSSRHLLPAVCMGKPNREHPRVFSRRASSHCDRRRFTRDRLGLRFPGNILKSLFLLKQRSTPTSHWPSLGISQLCKQTFPVQTFLSFLFFALSSHPSTRRGSCPSDYMGRTAVGSPCGHVTHKQRRQPPVRREPCKRLRGRSLPGTCKCPWHARKARERRQDEEEALCRQRSCLAVKRNKRMEETSSTPENERPSAAATVRAARTGGRPPSCLTCGAADPRHGAQCLSGRWPGQSRLEEGAT